MADSTGTSAHPFRFPRAYRLKRQRLIRPLFARGNRDTRTVASGCVRLVFRLVARSEMPRDVPLQVAFSPGGKVRKPVQRNHIKRMLREVYRMNQHILIDLFSHREDALTVMIIFRGLPEEATECLPRSLPDALRRVARSLGPAGGEGTTP